MDALAAISQGLIFEESVRGVLARAALPISPAANTSLSEGIYLHWDDFESANILYVEWRVHSSLRREVVDIFSSVARDDFLNDPRVNEKVNIEDAMRVAITAILKFAGFRILEENREMPGCIPILRSQ